jgi:quinol monooxygenase YgiN
MSVVIVAGYMDMDPGDREAFLQSREASIRRTRDEDGCIDYTFAADSVDPGRVRLFERWASRDALDAHLAALRSAPAPAAGPAPAVQVLGREILVHEVSSTGPLG